VAGRLTAANFGSPPYAAAADRIGNAAAKSKRF
jgi:hypothetical protein